MISFFNLKSSKYDVLTSVIVLMILLTVPLWLQILFCAFLVIFVEKEFKLPISILLLILSSLLNSGVDITGDLINYQYLYHNISIKSVVMEFNSEPVIVYMFKFFNLFGFDFKTVLFIQSFILNIIVFFVCFKYLGYNGLTFFALLTIFPPYIQMSLYLYRQSLSVVFFIFALFSNFPLLKYTFSFIIFVFPLSSSCLYILLYNF